MYSLKRDLYSESWRKITIRNKFYHRKRGPAIIYGEKSASPGDEFWYDNGRQFLVIKNDYSIETCTFQSDSHSFSDNPAVVYSNGTKEWKEYGILNRSFGPAVIYPNGDYEYWQFGRRHRIDGPAVIIGNKQYWFENGEFVKCIV